MLDGMVGRYRVEGQIGAGGMGVVYKGFDTDLNRPVAIKTLSDRRAITPEAIARLRAEALSAASLDHPYICKIYELVGAGVHTLIVMEFVDGETLEAKLRRGPLSIVETLRLGREIAEGLANAHARGLVHRDIKPSNVMVTTHGHVKLLDFGLARPDTLLEPEATTQSGTDQTARAGTPRYMAPEQALGQFITARVDVFAFGVLLFECLTGELPFVGLGTTAYLDGVVSSPAKPIARLAPAVPPDLVKLISQCLAKEPADRPASAAALAAELRRLEDAEATRESTSAAHAAHRSTRRWVVAVGAVAVVVIGIAVTMIVRERLAPKPDEVEHAELIVPPWPSAESGSRLSPDGTWVSFLSERNGQPRLFLQATAGDHREIRPIDVAAGVVLSHVWAPDSQRIACMIRSNDGTVLLQILSPFSSGAPVGLALDSGTTKPHALRWIDRSVYFTRDEVKVRSLYRLDLATGAILNVTKAWTPAGAFREFDVRPDGRVVFSEKPSVDADHEDLWVADLDGGHRTPLLQDQFIKRAPLWLGQRDAVVYQSNRDGRLALWEISTKSRATWQLAAQAPAEPQSVSADGFLLSFRQESEEASLVLVDAVGKTMPLTPGTWRDAAPSASQDGRVIAFQRSEPSPSVNVLDARLFVGERDGAVVRDAQDQGPGFDAALSPDGLWVAAFAPVTAFDWRLVVRNLKTAVTSVVTTTHPPESFFPRPFDWTHCDLVWSPDSTSLFFIDGGQAQVLQRYRPQSGEPAAAFARPEPAAKLYDLAFSADGRQLAFLTDSSSAIVLRVWSISAARETAAVPLGDRRDFLLRGWLGDQSLVVILRGPQANADGSVSVTVSEVTVAGGVRPITVLDHVFPATVRMDAVRKVLYFTRVNDGAPNVWAFSFGTGTARALTDNQSPTVTFSGVVPRADGAVLVARDESKRDVWLVRLKKPR